MEQGRKFFGREQFPFCWLGLEFWMGRSRSRAQRGGLLWDHLGSPVFFIGTNAHCSIRALPHVRFTGQSVDWIVFGGRLGETMEAWVDEFL